MVIPATQPCQVGNDCLPCEVQDRSPDQSVHTSAADPATKTAYMALTRLDKSSLRGHPLDGLGPDHLQLEANPCGVIMALAVNEGFNATSAQVCVARLVDILLCPRSILISWV